MLDQSLVDLLNSGRAWAFVGSGCSAAVVPTWGLLLQKIADKCDAEGALLSGDKNKIDRLARSGNLPEAFSLLKKRSSPSFVDKYICDLYGTCEEPSEITKLIAKWPFESYITTNWDHLIEQEFEKYEGCVSVGNTVNENAKVSGSAKNIIWHPHGGAKLKEKNLRLVVASEDYKEIYLDSPILSTLEAVLKMNRMVFIGFGFNDPDLLHTLNKISHLITPSRPAFGFLSNFSNSQIKDYWKKYKIIIIPYNATEGDHSDLINVLEAYGTFILDRDMSFEKASQSPEYDVDTVGILTHNRLINRPFEPCKGSVQCLTKGLILARLKINNFQTKRQLLESFSDDPGRFDVVEKLIDELIERGSIILKDGLLLLS